MSAEFQILSHAGLRVTNGKETLLIDPWLVGSSYWRSWWNYPPVRKETYQNLKPDAIYLTHIHWDHFQGPSLRLFSKDTLILVPKGNYSRMRDDLYQMGFRNVYELNHGECYSVAKDLRLYSYQFFPFLDSSPVIEVGGYTLLDANDAKFMGAPLDHILKRHPRIDFTFRSHSSANGRLCYEITDDPEAVIDNDETYLRHFASFVRKTKSTYAIPFASNHCFLHKEVFPLNSSIQTPFKVKEYFEKLKIDSPQVKVMLSGDTWNSEKGFTIDAQGSSFFDDREKHLEIYQRENQLKLEKFYRLEEKSKVSLKEMERYFTPFLKAVPFFLRFIYRNKPVTFVAQGGESKFIFELDLFKKQVRELKEVPARTNRNKLEIHTSAFILKQCLALKLFTHLQISKRAKFKVSRETKKWMVLFHYLFDFYEYELFPLRNNFRLRSLHTWTLRWRELLLYLQLFVNVVVLRKKFVYETYLKVPQIEQTFSDSLPPPPSDLNREMTA